MKTLYLNRSDQRPVTTRHLSKVLSAAVLVGGLLLPAKAKSEEAVRPGVVSAGSNADAPLTFSINADFLHVERVIEMVLPLRLLFLRKNQKLLHLVMEIKLDLVLFNLHWQK